MSDFADRLDLLEDLPDDGIPGPQVAEPETETVTLKLSARQVQKWGEIADILNEISGSGPYVTNAAGRLFFALTEQETMALVRRVAHQLRVQAGTA